MNDFEIRKKLEKTLSKKIGDENLVQELFSIIMSIGDQYELTLGGIREMCDLLDKIINKQITFDEFFDQLFEKLELTKEETLEVATLLEEIIERIKNIESALEEIKQLKRA